MLLPPSTFGFSRRQRGHRPERILLKGENKHALYLIERTFPDGLAIPVTDKGAQVCLTVIGNNAVDGVTWVHSYVTPDKKKTF